MQPWQIKALELEQSALKHLDGIIADHPLYASLGFIYLLMAFGICLILLIIRGRKKLNGKSTFHVPPVIIHLSEPPPPPPDTFDPFPPPHHSTYYDHDDE